VQALAALAAGLVFGIGLILAGMTNPAKVQGFLDITGAWDPSLAMVMGGAIAVGLFAFTRARRMPRSLLDAPMYVPEPRRVDRRLVLGSLTFGVGWGLGGFCPGPAVVWLGTGEPKAALFVLAMAGGMALFELLERRLKPAIA
jgi:uncharacterized membrane protein YedE/YeeE